MASPPRHIFWASDSLSFDKGQSWSWSDGSWIYNYLCNQCLSPLMLWFRIPLRRGVRDTTICDKVSQWLAAGRWFSPSTPLSSTNKTDRHDNWNIVETGVKHHNFSPSFDNFDRPDTKQITKGDWVTIHFRHWSNHMYR